MTPTVTDLSLGRVDDKIGGLRAGSNPISVGVVIGSLEVVGDDPVQRTSRSELMVSRVGLEFLEIISTAQLFAYSY